MGRAAASANPDQVKAAAPGTRLAAALAAWEVQAHRTLAADPDPADPVRVARVQAPITSTTDIVTEAAARKGHIDGDILQRLAPALEASQVAWSRAAKRWAELTSPASRTDPSSDRRSQRSPGRDRCHRHRPKRMGHTRAARKPSRPSQNGQGHSSQHGRIDRHRLRRPRHRGRPPRSHRSRAHHRAEVPREAEIAIEQGETRCEGVTWTTPRQLATNRLIALPEPARRGLDQPRRRGHRHRQPGFAADAQLDPTNVTRSIRSGHESHRGRSAESFQITRPHDPAPRGPCRTAGSPELPAAHCYYSYAGRH